MENVHELIFRFLSTLEKASGMPADEIDRAITSRVGEEIQEQEAKREKKGHQPSNLDVGKDRSTSLEGIT